jgi:hypothetical protein
MKKLEYNIGIFGTFDVENYGDLLFPIIAEEELKKRLGSVNLYRFSYHSKYIPEWPFETISLTELPRLIHTLDAILIGGGHIIRFDKNIASDYHPPTLEIHHPTGYWLAPSLLALQYGMPVIWNAPSLQDDIPDWAQPLLKLSLQNNRYISVRDELSKTILSDLIEPADIQVVPDTVFGISQLISREKPTTEFIQLCQAYGLTDPYMIIQATDGMETILSFLTQSHASVFEDILILALPMGPALGDHNEIFKKAYPNIIFLSEWPAPLLIAELICHATMVIGQSLHLAVTALTFEVPVFSSAPINLGKYKMLLSFENLHPLPESGEPELEWFIQAMKYQKNVEKSKEIIKALDKHWNHITGIIQDQVTGKSLPNLDRFWQRLPQILENQEKQLQSARKELMIREEELKMIYSSNSWKVTTLLRGTKSYLRRIFEKRR